MIFLAIDEMQSAACPAQSVADADASVAQVRSALCALRLALHQEQVERQDEEERLQQIHLQAGNE